MFKDAEGRIRSLSREEFARLLGELPAMDVLERLQGTHKTYVFTYDGKPVVRVNTMAWHKALDRSGIEDFRWHDLRTPSPLGTVRQARQPMSFNAWVAGKLSPWWSDMRTLRRKGCNSPLVGSMFCCEYKQMFLRK
jgi:hypothetical protein